MEVEYLLAHAFSTHEITSIYSQVPTTTAPSQIDEHEDRLEEEMQLLKKDNPEININFRAMGGPLITVLHDMVEDDQIDLVVMGTQGATGLSDKFLGTNAANAAKRLPCPVLIIPEGVTYKLPEKMVLATDFKYIDDLSVFDPVKAIIQTVDPHLLVLHVLMDDQSGTVGIEPIKKMLYQYFSSLKFSVHLLESADPSSGIEEFIQTHEIDWLVLVGSEKRLLKDLFRQSTIKKMAFHTEVPLLVLN